MRTDEERQAVEFLDRWRLAEKGPFNTAWPFDIILGYIRRLEMTNEHWERLRHKEMADDKP